MYLVSGLTKYLENDEGTKDVKIQHCYIEANQLIISRLANLMAGVDRVDQHECPSCTLVNHNSS